MWLICLVISGMLLAAESLLGGGGLKTGFYYSSCPKAETIVRSAVEAHLRKDPTIAAVLPRLHFRDCFVQLLPFSKSVLITLKMFRCWWSFLLNYFIITEAWVCWLLLILQGCDGSVMLTAPSAERNALPNLGLRHSLTLRALTSSHVLIY